ncbi:MAG TPA: ATP-binding cassette domain-containing protein [Conexibacter sp.]|jgi:ABC-type lipoprotein export system ATPase subunit|nr:ATP-binding cassette domain-containing protein [Conexibacter sp.]
MSLLRLERVSKRYRRGRRDVVALDDVSLTIDAGELVAIWGVPRSGRTTLLRIAAGLEQPDGGAVQFGGRVLPGGHDEGLAPGVGFVQVDLTAVGGESILDHVAMPLLARGEAPELARERAMLQLERVGAAGCAGLQSRELEPTEHVRVAIAQALVTTPRLLLVDDPTRHVDLLEREAVLLLVRSIADGEVAVLMTTGEAMGVSGVDRALTISGGVLRAEAAADGGNVVALRGSRSGGGDAR